MPARSTRPGVSRTSRALKALGEPEWAARVEGLYRIDEDGTQDG